MPPHGYKCERAFVLRTSRPNYPPHAFHRLRQSFGPDAGNRSRRRLTGACSLYLTQALRAHQQRLDRGMRSKEPRNRPAPTFEVERVAGRRTSINESQQLSHDN